MLHLWLQLKLHTINGDTRLHESGHKTTVKAPASITGMRRRTVAVDVAARMQLTVALRGRQERTARADSVDAYGSLYGWPAPGEAVRGFRPSCEPTRKRHGVYGKRKRHQLCSSNEQGPSAVPNARVGTIGPTADHEGGRLREFVASRDVDALHTFHKSRFEGGLMQVTEAVRAGTPRAIFWATSHAGGGMPKPPWRDHFSLSSGKLCQARAFFRVEGVSYALVHMYVAFRPQDNVPSLPLIARRTLQTAFVQHQGLQPAYAVVDRRQIMQPAFVVGDIARTTTAGVWQVARRQEWQNFDYRDHQCATAWKTTLR